MENNQQPAGEAQNSQKKVWYKKWWGIIIAILFLPLFVIWYIWEKTSWSNKKKSWATMAVVVFSIIIYSDRSDEKPPQQSENTPKTAQSTEATPEAKSVLVTSVPVVFDIPSLVGKSIDEVEKALGAPKNSSVPNKEQVALGIKEGSEGFEKDGFRVLVTYDIKTKEVLDFFLDGEDKGKLLAQGNLQEKSDAYVIDPVENLTDKSKITGVIITKKLTRELDANVGFNTLAFKIDNLENYDWKNCKFEINGAFFSGGYSYKTHEYLKAKDSIIIPFAEFTKDSKRFDFTAEKPEKLFIACDVLGQHRSNYFELK